MSLGFQKKCKFRKQSIGSISAATNENDALIADKRVKHIADDVIPSARIIAK